MANVRRWMIGLWVLALGLGSVLLVRAQGDGLTPPLEVYVMRTPPDGQAGLARVTFIEVLTGEMVSADVRGERFTLVGDYVLYQDPDTQSLYRLWPDGRTEQHPFIQREAATQRVDWVVSPDRAWIAWMLSNQTADGLQTVTTLARADGTEPQIILTDGSDSFVHAVPVALTNDGLFFYDRQPQTVGDYFFYRQYASLYRLDTRAGVMAPELLPFEPNCFCGAGFAADGLTLARLERVTDEGGYDVRLWDLTARIDTFARTLSTTFQAAGAVLVAPDGRQAVYSLANNLTLDSAETGRERFMLALVDAESGEQRALIANTLLVPLLPLAWTDDASGVLLYNPRQDGTWKINLESGEIKQVAAGTYLGDLR